MSLSIEPKAEPRFFVFVSCKAWTQMAGYVRSIWGNGATHNRTVDDLAHFGYRFFEQGSGGTPLQLAERMHLQRAARAAAAANQGAPGQPTS